MSDSLRILAIGAHPDDCDLCFGGTALKFIEAGSKVKFISATNGDTGHHIIGGGELARRRYAETREAARVAGLFEYEIFDIHNNGLVADIPTRERFIRAIREFSPDVLFTHRTVDYHPDHRATAQLVQDSSYAIIIPNVCALTPPMKKPPVIMYFADSFKKPCPFTPDAVVDIDSVLDKKIEMFSCQTSQVYEWLAYADGVIDTIPDDPDERIEWIKNNTAITRTHVYADRFRDMLIAKYGKERGEAVRNAEAFELSEYGRIPSAEELSQIFGF